MARPYRWMVASTLLLVTAAPSRSQENVGGGWISHPQATAAARPIVVMFRRSFDVPVVPSRFPVKVSADNRFILYVNGSRVAAGPSAGDISHWRYERLDLAHRLRRGKNVIAAIVWNGVKPPPAAGRKVPPGGDAITQTAPAFQQTVSTGFWLRGVDAAAGVSTDRTGWRVKVEAGRSFANGFRQTLPQFYVAGAPESIDAAASDRGWTGPQEGSDEWIDAVAAPDAAKRTLVADRLPLQRFAAVPVGEVVRTDLIGGRRFPARPVSIPANTHVKLLVRRVAMVSGYPALETRGGKGATIRATYAEALYDDQGRKGDRDLVADRKPRGISDTFAVDGTPFTFAPLWWRTWRYLELDVTTAAEPLTLQRLTVNETGYPFVQVARFASSDPALDRIWQVGWRTAQIDAHETYMDSAYWEQLQYVGDTRLQMLISYAVAGDPRLAEQAIDAIASSHGEGALTQGAYPSRGENVIPPFSLLWIGMLEDWRMQQPDTRLLVRHLPRMREILAWYRPWLGEGGLLRRNPGWNFVDWIEKEPGDKSEFPAYSTAGESCLTSAIYLGALQQAARIERQVGDARSSAEDATVADRVAAAIRARCWSSERGLFADNPDARAFSQQMNALAVLYGVVTGDRAQQLLDRIVESGRGIDPPQGIAPSSYYFSWYLVRAFAAAGLANHYHDLLATWRELLKLNYTTWPERRGNTRSDTHAWSAHPTADLLGLVAGIGPQAPGYVRVRVEPSLGTLNKLDATASTPKGPVDVSYRMVAGRLLATVTCPPGLPGIFVWHGDVHQLKSGQNRFNLPADRQGHSVISNYPGGVGREIAGGLQK